MRAARCRKLSKVELRKLAGQRFQEARLHAGMTVEETAAALHYSTSTDIRNIEAGRRMIPNYRLAEICKLFQTDKKHFIQLINAYYSATSKSGLFQSLTYSQGRSPRFSRSH